MEGGGGGGTGRGGRVRDGRRDTRYKNLCLTSDTFKQITLAIKAIFRQTCYKANIQQVKLSFKSKTF